MIAGFEVPTNGEIRIRGERVKNRPPEGRNTEWCSSVETRPPPQGRARAGDPVGAAAEAFAEGAVARSAPDGDRGEARERSTFSPDATTAGPRRGSAAPYKRGPGGVGMESRAVPGRRGDASLRFSAVASAAFPRALWVRPPVPPR